MAFFACGTRDQPYASPAVPDLPGSKRDTPDWLSDIKMAKAPFGAFFLNKIIDSVDFGFGIWSRRLIKVENEI
ncbi:hypothetical protein I0600191H4_20310 [Collinsella sp. i06-0019-1H4]